LAHYGFAILLLNLQCGVFCDISGANAPFSIMISKVLRFFILVFKKDEKLIYT